MRLVSPRRSLPANSPWCLAALLAIAGFALAREEASAGEFRPGSVTRVEDLPPGRFRLRLERLPGPARERAIAWLRRSHFPDQDVESLEADDEGGIFYVDVFPGQPAPQPAAIDPPVSPASVPVSPFPAGLIFHSRPGSPNVLYLNFAGESVNNTAWNTSLSRTVIPAVAFSTDADLTTFSDAEQLVIKRVWQRVAEDYSPFDIDVTTERPAVMNNRTALALITRNTDANGDPNPSSTGGGVAYLDVFGGSGYATYRPAWIYHNNLASDESYIAEAASHEVGHNMGLSHDGQTGGTEYYGGHGSGDTSWGPLMGTGYNRNVSPWSKGDYYLANNTQDDLVVIAAKLSLRPDDHGDTSATATWLRLTGGTSINSTTPESDPANANPANKGVLEHETDVDVFAFATGNGSVSLIVTPWVTPGGRTRGGNTDVLIELHDAAGSVIATNNPADRTDARIEATLAEGVYYLYVRPTGTGNPMSSTPTGYTSYGSLGQYFISGTVVASSSVIPPTAVLQATNVTQVNAGAAVFTVTYADNMAIQVGTIDGDDVRVTGPRGYDRLARLLGVSASTDGTPRVATYAADPPAGGSWTDMDRGAYLVSMQASQVADTEGAWVAAGTLGTFVVDVPRLLYFASLDQNPGWTLQPQWQYGPPAYASGGPTSGYTGVNIIGYNLSGNYANNLPLTYATTPPINCTGVSTLTLQFARWLGLRSADTAVLQVSTNGTTWTDVWSTQQALTDPSWQTVQYGLPSWAAGSPSVQLRWGIASDAARTAIGWNLDDVQLFGSASIDTVPPSALLSAANITGAGAATEPFTVTYADATAVSVATLGSTDVLVTGPNGYTNLAQFVGVDLASDGTPRVASYSVPAPSGAWQAADNGTYTVALQNGEVADISNNAAPGAVLGSFTVAIPVSQQALVVTPTALRVIEGTQTNFTVQLAEAPTAPITVTVTRVKGETNLVVAGGAVLDFNATNWSVPKPVTIAALPDPDQLNGVAAFECSAPGLAPVTVSVTGQDTTPNAVLTVTVNNPAWGGVSPAGGSFPVGYTVPLLATPATYFQFVQWSGDASGSDNPVSMLMDTNHSVGATFAELLTTNHPTPLWWLASYGYTQDFESAVLSTGANGIPVWQSYIAGLDPTDPNSQLRLSISLAYDGTNVVLSWNPVSGRDYTVLQSTNVAQGFAPLAGASQLPWTTQSLTNASVGVSPAAFYRLEVHKP